MAASPPSVDSAAGSFLQTANENHEDENEKDQWQEANQARVRTAPIFSNRSAGAAILTLRGLHQGLHSGAHPCVEVACTEVRLDAALDDVLGCRIGNSAFQAVTNLNVDLAALNEDKEDGAIVLARKADFPALRDTDGVILDAGVALHAGVDDRQDLAGGAALEVGELCVQLASGGLRDHVRKVIEVILWPLGQPLCPECQRAEQKLQRENQQPCRRVRE